MKCLSALLRLHSVLWLVIAPASAWGAITWTGDIDPADPTTWTSSSSSPYGTDGFIGKTTHGTIAVDGGSELRSYRAYLGDSAGSTGEVTISGVGSLWKSSGFINVGRRGSGTLNVQAGGSVDNTYHGYLGTYPGSIGVATVTGAGSLWGNKYDMYVGRQGSGTLNIRAGGTVNNTDGYLGYDSGSTGEATITGIGSHWINRGTLFVGRGGSGLLHVEDGGQVTAATLYASMSDLQGNGTINVTKGAVLDGDLLFDATHGTQYVLPFGSGGALTVTADGGDLGAGYKGAGSLTIADGVSATGASGYLGYSSGSTGAATVTGSDSQWINSGTVYVGRDGSGTLDIKAGGAVTSNSGMLGLRPGSSGEATVAGITSKWNSSALYVGHGSSGKLTIQDGGSVNSYGSYLGFGSGSTGEVTVSGLGSHWNNNGYLYIGDAGSGQLNIEAGGTVTSAYGLMGHGPGTSAVTVSGIGSEWINTYSLHVGGNGGGTLNIRAGGKIRSGQSRVGGYSGVTGEATVNGIGSQWTTSGILYVGGTGSGTLTIEAGGTVINTHGYLGDTDGSTGVVTVAGIDSKWISESDLYVGRYGRGTLTVEEGGTVTSTNGYLGFGGRSKGEVRVTGISSEWNISGFLRVGPGSNGTLTISSGGLVNVAGSLSTDLYSDSGSSVNLATGGMLALASDASGDDSLTNFLALVGGTKAIRYWDDALADWAPITAATYGDDYTLEYLTSGDLAGYTLLTVGKLPALAGDYNDDGIVDAADYTVWRDNLGQNVTLPNQATPGSVTEHDRDVWAANYGATLTGGAIPEPSALVLAAFMLGGLALGRRS